MFGLAEVMILSAGIIALFALVADSFVRAVRWASQSSCWAALLLDSIRGPARRARENDSASIHAARDDPSSSSGLSKEIVKSADAARRER
jgi:hypothetical protein